MPLKIQSIFLLPSFVYIDDERSEAIYTTQPKSILRGRDKTLLY